MSVYLTCLPGGYVARRFLGTWRSLLLGGLVVAIGHYLLAIPALTSLYAGLSLIALSSGLLGPNLHTMVGRLYVERDSRRDSGFSILYIGMNIDSLISA